MPNELSKQCQKKKANPLRLAFFMTAGAVGKFEGLLRQAALLDAG